MSKSSLIVHRYFKCKIEEGILYVKVNPLDYTGEEIFVNHKSKNSLRKMIFDKDIFEDLEVDGFEESSPLEYQLILRGLA